MIVVAGIAFCLPARASTFGAGEATIFVPASAGRFVKAVIGVAAPAEGE